MVISLPSIAVAAQDIDVLVSASTYQERLLQLIKGAKRRIQIVALYLQNDEAGQAIIEALYQAKEARPELEITIFVDFHRAQRGLIGEGKQLGNRAYYLDCAKRFQHQIDIHGVAVKNKEFMGVLHLKGMVFDDILFYSGASINNIYLQYADKYRLDRYFEISSSELADSFCQHMKSNLVDTGFAPLINVEHEFEKKEVKVLSRRTQSRLKRSSFQFNATTINKEQPITITPLVGLGKRNNLLNKTIVDMLKQSKSTIELYTPYFNLPNPVLRQLLRALKRGLKVTIVIGDKEANDFYIRNPEEFSTIGIVPYLYESILQRFVKRYQRFLDSGLLDIRLWKDNENSYHLKGLCIDDNYHMITGSNVNPRAWSLDVENGLFIKDEMGLLSDKISAERDVIYQNTQKVNHFSEIETIKDYPIKPQKLMRRIKLSKIDGILKRFL